MLVPASRAATDGARPCRCCRRCWASDLEAVGILMGWVRAGGVVGGMESGGENSGTVFSLGVASAGGVDGDCDDGDGDLGDEDETGPVTAEEP